VSLREVIVDHARHLTWSSLSEPEQIAAKRLTADSVAVAVAARDVDVIERLEEALGTQPGDVDAAVPVLGRPDQPLEAALVVNCALVRQLDLMDVFWDRDVCHPSENVPVAMTAGAAYGADGEQVLAATVVGYDVQVALCRLMSFAAAGLHHVSAAGIAVPALLSRLLDLDARTAAEAVALGAYRSHTLGALSRGELSNAKSFSYGLTATDALRAIRLAQAGLTGPRKGLEWLLREVAGEDVSDEDLRSALGGSVTSVAMKRYPVQFALQGCVEAAATIAAQLRGGLDATSGAQVTVRVPSWTIERTVGPAKLAPTNRETADHSLAICTAMALLDGDLTSDAMLAGRWEDPDVRGLAGRLRVEEDAELARLNPGGGPAHVVVELPDGSSRTARVEHPLGDPARPMSDSELRAKFDDLVRPRLGFERSTQVWDAIMSLDTQRDIRPVMALTKPALPHAVRSQASTSSTASSAPKE